MLKVSRNNINDYIELPFVDDAEFSDHGNSLSLDRIISKNNSVKKNSLKNDINLIYLVKEDCLIGIAKKEYLHAIFYLKSGLILKLYNLTDCNYEENTYGDKRIIENIKIKFNKHSLFQKIVFKNLDLVNVVVYTNDRDMKFDLNNDTLVPIKNEEIERMIDLKKEVEF